MLKNEIMKTGFVKNYTFDHTVTMKESVKYFTNISTT